MKPNDLSLPIQWGGKKMAEPENNREKFIRAWWLHLAGWEQGSCWRVSIVLGLWSSTKDPHPPKTRPLTQKHTTQPQQEMCLSERPVSHREMRARSDCVTVNRALVQVSHEVLQRDFFFCPQWQIGHMGHIFKVWDQYVFFFFRN